jgi:hypothetical protein
VDDTLWATGWYFHTHLLGFKAEDSLVSRYWICRLPKLASIIAGIETARSLAADLTPSKAEGRRLI